MDSQFLDVVAALIGDLGHSGIGFSHLLVYHIEEKRFQSKEVSIRSRFRCSMRSDQRFVPLHILARSKQPEESRGTRNRQTRW